MRIADRNFVSCRLFSILSLIVLFSSAQLLAQQGASVGDDKNDGNNRATSRIETAKSGDLVLIQELTIQAPVEQVWDAYTTPAGWQSWISPVAEVDLKTGGIIRTNYRADGRRLIPMRTHCTSSTTCRNGC